jgi:hypothetical protein
MKGVNSLKPGLLQDRSTLFIFLLHFRRTER